MNPLDICNRNVENNYGGAQDSLNSDIIFVKNGHPVITKVDKSASIKRGERPPIVDPTSMRPLYEIAKLDMSSSKLNP